eukprot:Clim_evm120s109 gene=Clim_evmTU120s109
MVTARSQPGQKNAVGAKGYDAPGLPLYLSGPVARGYGRGGKELGCPTANFSQDKVDNLPADLESGIYMGWAGLRGEIYPMVMSIGWNPFYNNQKRSAEAHLISNFDEDFYGEQLNLIICGYIRPEKNYDSLEALKDDINADIEFTRRHLDHESQVKYRSDPFLNTSSKI